MTAPTTPDLFKTVPDQDYLGFFDGARLRPKKVVGFLELNQGEVANAVGIPKSKVRYDPKMPTVVRNRLREIAIICDRVAEILSGDVAKTSLWFQVNNPGLGGISPKEMIRRGRFHKLEKYINDAMSGNRP